MLKLRLSEFQNSTQFTKPDQAILSKNKSSQVLKYMLGMLERPPVRKVFSDRAIFWHIFPLKHSPGIGCCKGVVCTFCR